MLLDHEAPLFGVMNLCAQSAFGGSTYNPSIGNPVKILSDNPRDHTALERTSLHSVFVSRPYLSGRSFLHLLQTRQPNVFLKLWSMSIVWHSLHFGFISGSSDISFDISVHSRGETRKTSTYEVPGCASPVVSPVASPLRSFPRLLLCHPRLSTLPWCFPS